MFFLNRHSFKRSRCAEYGMASNFEHMAENVENMRHWLSLLETEPFLAVYTRYACCYIGLQLLKAT